MPEGDLRARRRGEILDAARQIVVEEGLGRLTISALERRLSFTRGVITYHFDNKDEILGALLDEAVADIDVRALSAVEAEEDPVLAVEAAIRAMVLGFLEHRDASQVLIGFWGRLTADDRARQRNALLYRGYRERAAGLVRHGQGLGRFRDDADPDAAAAVMVGAVIGIVGQILFDPGKVEAEGAIRTAGRSLGTWLCSHDGFP